MPLSGRAGGTAGKVRLFCFPYAGGSATAFAPWAAHLPAWVDLVGVQLPGRGGRLAEPAYTDIEALLDALVPVIEAEGRMRCAFFGHSLGGLLAFGLARRLRRRGAAMPLHLFVSASGAPQLHRTAPSLHLLDDEALLSALREYNGTPQEAPANRELMSLLLPAIRADFALRAGYHHQEEPPLAVPITVFAGTRDPHVSPEQAHGWGDCTTAPFAWRHFDGDHFILHSHAASMAECITAALTDASATFACDAVLD
jgi:surfactin synthase thioesterase subunit